MDLQRRARGGYKRAWLHVVVQGVHGERASRIRYTVEKIYRRALRVQKYVVIAGMSHRFDGFLCQVERGDLITSVICGRKGTRGERHGRGDSDREQCDSHERLDKRKTTG